MLNRILLTYNVEVQKALSARQHFVGPLLVLFILACAPLVHPIDSPGAGGYAFVAYITPLVLNFLGFVLIQIFAASQISSEVSSGAIRQMLVRPILRSEYYLGKLALCMSYVVLLTVLTAGASWGAAATWGTLDGVHYGGQLAASHHELWVAYVTGMALSLLPQWTAACIALFFSVAARSSSAAVALSIGTWIAVDFVKYPLGLERFVYTSYLEAPWQIFSERVDDMETTWLPMAYYCAGTSLITGFVFVFGGILLLNKRNLGS